MAQQRRATFQEVLLAIKARLVACGFLSNQIAYLATNAIPDFIGDTSIYIRPRGMRSVHSGGFRYSKVVTRLVDIIVKITSAADESGNDLQYLTDDEESIFVTEDRVLDALEAEVMFDANRNALTTTALQLIQDSDPEKNRRPHLGDVWMTFEVQYQPILTLPRINV